MASFCSRVHLPGPPGFTLDHARGYTTRDGKGEVGASSISHNYFVWIQTGNSGQALFQSQGFVEGGNDDRYLQRIRFLMGGVPFGMGSKNMAFPT